MKEILEYLKNTDFIIDDVITDKDEITHIYCTKQDTCYSIVEPHSGNDFKYMLRSNKVSTFDRWSVCENEDFFENPKKLLEKMKEDDKK